MISERIKSKKGISDLEKNSAGFGPGSANYLGSNRILRGSWPHGLPPLGKGVPQIQFCDVICNGGKSVQVAFPPHQSMMFVAELTKILIC